MPTLHACRVSVWLVVGLGRVTWRLGPAGQRRAGWLGSSPTHVCWGTGERSMPCGRVGQVQELGRGALGHEHRSGPRGGSGIMMGRGMGSGLTRGHAGLGPGPHEGLLSWSRAEDGWATGEPFV